MSTKPASRSVRVFVSSTFRDMSAERDELATHTWPALRALCEERAVTFTDVDLRWGITDEQAAEGHVLPICLAEIDASRPYFVGILGERYGWVPDEIPGHLVGQMQWLAEHREHSVTELEIVHGVLNDPEMAGRAFFYFRDPDYARSVPAERRSDFVSEDARAVAKLAALKDRIRASGLPVREGFTTPEQLASWVIEDLGAVIKEEYPLAEAPDPLARDRLAHESHAMSRRGVYIGRPSYVEALDSHAAGNGPPLIVTGQSGGGKSALLANWAHAYRASHPDTLVIEHYCGASADSTEWTAMCRRIVGELSAATGVEIKLPSEVEEFRDAFKYALYRFAATHRIVLVLDGINQLEDKDGAPDLAWLPHDPPPSLRLVFSALPGRALEEARRRGWTELAVEPLSPQERSRLITAYLSSFAKSIDPALAGRIASASQASNPLFVRVLLDELRVEGDHASLEATVEHYLEASEVDDLYELVLERLETDYERERSGLVRDTMSAIWAARRGLSESELLGILGQDGTPLARAVFSPLYLAVRPMLISRSGLLGFAHDFLRQAVEDRYLPGDEEKRAAHGKLAEWFGRQEVTARVLDEAPWQLMSGEAWDDLAQFMSTEGLLGHLWLNSHDDILLYATELEQHGWSSVQSYAGLTPAMPLADLWAASVILCHRGHPSQAAALFEGISTEDLLPVGLKASSLLQLSATLGVCGDYQRAQVVLAQTENLAQDAGDVRLAAHTLLQTATLCLPSGDYEEGLTALQRAEQGFRDAGIAAPAEIPTLRAWLLSAGEQYGAARHELARAAEAIRQTGDARAAARMLSTASALEFREQMSADEPMSAEGLADHCDHLAEAAECLRAMGDVPSLAAVLPTYALALEAASRLDEAAELLLESERLCRSIGDSELLKSALLGIASVEEKLGNYDRALAAIDEAIMLTPEGGEGRESYLRKRHCIKSAAIRASEDPNTVLMRAGQDAWLDNRSKEAAVIFEQLRRAALAEGNEPVEAEAACCLAETKLMEDDPLGAAAILAECAVIGALYADKTWTATLANVLRYCGIFEPSETANAMLSLAPDLSDFASLPGVESLAGADRLRWLGGLRSQISHEVGMTLGPHLGFRSKLTLARSGRSGAHMREQLASSLPGGEIVFDACKASLLLALRRKGVPPYEASPWLRWPV